MRELTEKETQILADKIEKSGLRYHPLREELLDHLCCATEEKMWEGATFSEAVAALSDVFKEDEMKKIETDTLSLLHSKSKIMKQISLAVLPLLLCVFFYPHYADKSEPVAEAVTLTLTDPPNIAPLQSFRKITSGFGMRIHPFNKVKQLHKGTDFSADFGTPIVAPSGGTVVLVEDKKSGYGKQVMIAHDSTYTTRYAHLSEIDVVVGDEIEKGKIIGKVGSSGASLSPHLHYEVIENGKNVDPEKFFGNLRTINNSLAPKEHTGDH